MGSSASQPKKYWRAEHVLMSLGEPNQGFGEVVDARPLDHWLGQQAEALVESAQAFPDRTLGEVGRNSEVSIPRSSSAGS